MTESVTPDGERWRYRYDPLGRRTAKQRLDASEAVIEETLFFWDGVALRRRTSPPSGGAAQDSG